MGKRPFEAIHLGLILVAASFLRFFDLGNMPFMHDELSAVHRLHYSTFSALIESGVKPDGHPAGIQVFLFYFRKLAGTSESALKIPFMLMGVFSIWFTWKLGKLWFNQTAALMTAATVATLQFHVFYSQLARPYISGYLFCVAMVYYWTKYLFSDESRYKDLAGFIFFATLSCYNHYFSHLTAILTGITGLLFLKKGTVVPYLLSGLAIALLYLPHLGVFLHHFEVGGLGGEGGWLGKPREDFFILYLQYIFHYSPIVYTTFALLIIAGIATAGKVHLKKTNRFRLISLAWFLAPFFIGYYYSIYKNPVLQNAILFFSFPFLILFIFSFFREQANPWIKTGVVLLLLTVNTITLVVSRKHYDLFYRQPFRQYALYASTLMNEAGSKNVQCSFNTDTDYVKYYFNRYGLPWDSSWKFNRDDPPAVFREYIRGLKAEYVICDNLPFEHLAVLQEFFPHPVYHETGFTYDLYCFTNKKLMKSQRVSNSTIYTANLTFENPDTSWNYNPESILADSSTGSFYRIHENQEWGPAFKKKLTDLAKSRHNLILMSASVRKKAASANGLLVMSLENENGETIDWKGIDVNKCGPDTGIWTKMLFGFRISDRFKSYREMKNVRLSFYFWNKDRKQMDVDDFKLETEKGNRFIYGLYEDIR